MSSSPMHLNDPNAPTKPERDGLAIVPVLVAILVIGLFVFAGYTIMAPQQVATASIDRVTALELPSNDRIAVELEFSITNTSTNPLKYHSIDVKVVTAKDTFKDTPASLFEVPRIYAAYPALHQSTEDPIKQDMMIQPGATLKGVVILAFPIKKVDFDSRKSIEAAVFFYDESPVHVKK